MTKVLDYSLEVNEFELQSHNYIHFWTNTLGKSMNILIYELKDTFGIKWHMEV